MITNQKRELKERQIEQDYRLGEPCVASSILALGTDEKSQKIRKPGPRWPSLAVSEPLSTAFVTAQFSPVRPFWMDRPR
jgi:hypothetical protein